MFMLNKIFFTILLVAATTGILSAQQVENSRPSPVEKSECKLPGGKSIAVTYSSPRMRGRKIFSGLVPYGKIWRTGANQATTFVTNENLISVAGTNIPAGSYTISTIPDSHNWILIINKHTGEWGIPYKYESEELARVPMSATTMPSSVENFTISFSHTTAGCAMHISWENTEASVEFSVRNTDVPNIP